MTNSPPSRFQSWLRAELGRPPGAIWLTVLWASLTVTFGNVLFTYGRFVERFVDEFFIGQPLPPLPETVAHFTLPVAVLAAALHWLMTRTGQITQIRRGGVAVLAILLAAEAYWLPPHLFFWPRLLGATIPATVDRLIWVVWPGVVLSLILGLIATCRRRPFALPWRIFIVGSATGTVAIIRI